MCKSCNGTGWYDVEEYPGFRVSAKCEECCPHTVGFKAHNEYYCDCGTPLNSPPPFIRNSEYYQ